jgi:hypothetical protein
MTALKRSACFGRLKSILHAACIEASNTEGQVQRLMTNYLWREGEPATPSHFSSPGLSMD